MAVLPMYVRGSMKTHDKGNQFIFGYEVEVELSIQLEEMVMKLNMHYHLS